MANFGDDKNILKKENKEKENNTTAAKDREEKLKIIRDKQNDERQRKLEELKAQALAAQKFREQKEEERKRRIEDLKSKENDRRYQVEERKKAICEAERERREYILKRNQEREARIDYKRKNERSSIIFAFGSSTPRLLNSIESNVSPSAFWNHRRATSITNVALTSNLTRRSSERDISDGPKKRATSASGLDRKNEDEADTSHNSNRSVCRRKTDLMPTVPNTRDRSFYGSRSSLGSLTPRSPGLRSGEVTPGGSIGINGSRPGSAMSSSICANVISRRTLPRKPRPVSIAGTGVTVSGETVDSPRDKLDRPPLPRTLVKTSSMTKSPARSLENGKTPDKKTTAPKTPRPSSSKSQTTTHSSSSNVVATATTNNKTKTPPAAADVTPIPATLPAAQKTAGPAETNGAVVDRTAQQIIENSQDTEEIVLVLGDDVQNSTTATLHENEEVSSQLQSNITTAELEAEAPQQVVLNKEEVIQQQQQQQQEPLPENDEPQPVEESLTPVALVAPIAPVVVTASEPSIMTQSLNPIENMADMSASFMAKNRINTEEQAKAALAERRRLAREEAERQAELERIRIEEEEQLAIQKQLEEEEEQRRLEEEATRLAQLQRKVEEERLAQAIEEAQKREEEEKQKREEENRLKIEREEQERKAREEAEKQRIETAERLKKEEKEREERRKRVEAIMARTRAKGGNGNSKTNNDSQNNDQSATPTKTNMQQQEDATLNNDSSNSDVEVKNNGVQLQSAANTGDDDDETTSTTTTVQIDEQSNIEIVNIKPNKDSKIEYENSVTEKENSLLGSFDANNHIVIVDKQHQQQQNVAIVAPPSPQENGKANNLNSADFIIENKNGHQGYSITNIMNTKETTAIDGITDIIKDQLIDFNSSPNSIEEFNNKSNNNNNTSTTTTTLVTSDSQENRDLPYV